MKYYIQFLTGFVSANKLIAVVLCLIFAGCYESSENISSQPEPHIESIYVDPVSVDSKIKLIAAESPICLYKYLGTSSDGAFPISKIIISDNPEKNEEEPEISIIGGVHGDEQASVYVPLKLIEYFVNNYDDPEIKNLVDSNEFHIIPVMNPYGLKNRKRYTVNNVDLNRNFSWAWTDEPYHGNEPFDQNESLLIKHDAEQHNYSFNITFHAGENCISTAWDYIGTVNSEGTPEYYPYEQFVSHYLPNAEIVFSYASDYETDVVLAGDEEFYSIEGFDWYPCYGTVGDWFLGTRGAVAYTIELTQRKRFYPDYDVSEVWDLHKEALLNLLQMSATGLRGSVYDGETKEPLPARITLEKLSRDPRDPVVYKLFGTSDSDAGFFHIISGPGSFTVTITSENYESYTDTITIGKSLDIGKVILQKSI